jgi:hypothetical protein
MKPKIGTAFGAENRIVARRVVWLSTQQNWATMK